MIGQQVPYTISQNVSFATNPTDFGAGPDDWAIRSRRSRRCKPRTTAELQAANPRVLGHSFENETPYAEQWHLGVERRVMSALAVEMTYAGSAGKHLVFCYNPNEVQPGIGTQESRRLIQPLNRLNNMLQCDPRNRSTYHSGQLKVTQRFRGGLQFLGSYTYGKALDYGGSAASGGGAVGNPQTITNLDGGSWTGRLRRPPPRGDQLGLGNAVGARAALAAQRRRARRDRRRLAIRRHRHHHHRAAVHGVHAERRQQRRDRAGRTGSDPASSTIRPSISGTTRAISSRRRPTPTATAAAASSTVPATSNFDTSLSKRFTVDRPGERRVPLGRVQPVQSSRLRLPEPELRFADRRAHHVNRRSTTDRCSSR